MCWLVLLVLKVNRQIKLEEVVNAEVSALSVLVLHLQDYFRYKKKRNTWLVCSFTWKQKQLHTVQ